MKMKQKVSLLTFNRNPYDDRIYFKEARTLKEAGFQVKIIGPFQEVKDREGISFYSINFNKNPFRMIRQMMEVLDVIEPDVIQFYDPIFVAALKKLRRKRQIRVIYNVSESYPDMMREFSRKPFFVGYVLSHLVRLREERNANLWDGIITTDDALYERFKQMNDKVVLVHLYPQLSLFSNISFPQIPEQKLRLVYIGQLRSERGIFSLIKAVKIFSERNNISVLCDFYGDFSYVSEENLFHFEVQHFGLRGVVNYKGSISHERIPATLSNYHVGVVTLLPIRKFMKNEPTKLFEYMAAGLPVLGSNLPPISRYVNRFQCGVLCDPLQPARMSNAIENLIEDRERYLRFSRNGRSAVENELNWESQKTTFLSIFQ